MTLLAYLHRRQDEARRRDAHATNAALGDASRDMRRRAQRLLDEGRPDAAQPYLDEAELFESAVQPPRGL